MVRSSCCRIKGDRAAGRLERLGHKGLEHAYPLLLFLSSFIISGVLQPSWSDE